MSLQDNLNNLLGTINTVLPFPLQPSKDFRRGHVPKLMKFEVSYERKIMFTIADKRVQAVLDLFPNRNIRQVSGNIENYYIKDLQQQGGCKKVHQTRTTTLEMLIPY